MLVTWRESLEAAIIIGILLTAVRKMGDTRGAAGIWGGAALGVLASLVLGGIVNLYGFAWSGPAEKWMELGVFSLAAVLLAQMLVWMQKNKRILRGEIERRAEEALTRGAWGGVMAIAFLGVLREGAETVLFLWSIMLQQTETVSHASLLAAGVGGIVLAGGLAWLFFAGISRLPVAWFFRVSTVLLVLLISGLAASAVHEAVELGLVPPLMNPVWDTSWLLDHKSLAGTAVRTLTGYRSKPALTEVLAYGATLAVVSFLVHRAGKSSVRTGIGS
ncbi:MAG: hypothetical protein A2V83_09245 [Nitrospirae bacterium RBG_16_64_22]|nr:MAG: hypothetical protein A2V83_09245 [Nitrospirae bacterium RBG_16_64_22]